QKSDTNGSSIGLANSGVSDEELEGDYRVSPADLRNSFRSAPSFENRNLPFSQCLGVPQDMANSLLPTPAKGIGHGRTRQHRVRRICASTARRFRLRVRMLR